MLLNCQFVWQIYFKQIELAKYIDVDDYIHILFVYILNVFRNDYLKL